MQTMTRPTRETSKHLHPPRICPYLALRFDPTVVAQYATPEHACQRHRRHLTPSLEHQSGYCLTSGHSECPTYVVANARGVAYFVGAKYSKLASQLFGTLTILLFLILMLAWVAIRFPAIDKPSSQERAETTSTSASSSSASVSSQMAEVDLLPTVTPTPPSLAVAMIYPESAGQRFVTPTPEQGGTVYYIRPTGNEVGWWHSGSTAAPQIGDSFLYAGQSNQQTYISAVHFDLTQLTRGAPVRSARLRLTGLRSEGISAETSNRWVVQFIAEETLPDLTTATFLAIFSAPAAITLLPEMQPSDLAVDHVNEWALDANVCLWLEQELLKGATSVTVRLMASTNGDNALFAWDSGYGTESKGGAPGLLVSLGAAPATPPPLPTRPIFVATLTPLPQNVVTAVAQAATSTAQAIAYGTNTPVPFDIVTPTPFPENLATVQANALAQGLPPVLLNTPVPANPATATADAAYATAVALTTGTFTPQPTGYVTPVLLYPPPPAENVATAAARVVAATEQARLGIPTATVPWNGVHAIYVYATATPANAVEAAQQIQDRNAAAVTTGTPTPTPWNLVVITAVPPPRPTEIPIIVPVDQLEPTATPVPTTPATMQDLEAFRGLILFLSDRTGETETWVLDPNRGDLLYLVRDTRLHPLARQLYLANSPDGSQQALVEADDHRDLQIKIHSRIYGNTWQITNFAAATSYDPAWSPLGDRIAFVSTTSGGDEIYTIDTQGNDLRRLTENSWEWDKHPSWSPDGSQIVFYSNRENGRRQIWIMNADGSNPRNLSNDEFENWDPVWIR